MFKTLSLVVVGSTLALALVAGDAHAAKRLGGGKSTGMQRESITQPHTPNAPSSNPSVASAPKPANAAAAPAAPAAPKRSWLGPIAGLAAGLGLAALASHLGLGEELATFMMLALLGVALLAVVGWVMRKRMAPTQPQPAWAGAGMEPTRYSANDRGPLGAAGGMGAGGSLIGADVAGASAAGRVWPQGFDAAAFEANARQQFLALQAAHDAANLAEIRRCTTDEMYEALRQEVANRGPQPATEVRDLRATVVDVAEDANGHVVTVHFTGTVVEDGGVAEPLDEYWHLTKSRFGHGGWLLAGIQQAG